MKTTTVKSKVQGAVDRIQEVFGNLVDAARGKTRKAAEAGHAKASAASTKAAAAPAQSKRAATSRKAGSKSRKGRKAKR